MLDKDDEQIEQYERKFIAYEFYSSTRKIDLIKKQPEDVKDQDNHLDFDKLNAEIASKRYWRKSRKDSIEARATRISNSVDIVSIIGAFLAHLKRWCRLQNQVDALLEFDCTATVLPDREEKRKRK